MEKMKKFEDFDVDESEVSGGEKVPKARKNYSFIKLVIFLSLILIICFIYFVFTAVQKNEKKNELSRIHVQKDLLLEGTKKMIAVLATVDDTLQSLDNQTEEIKIKNQELKAELKNFKDFVNINNTQILKQITEERDKEEKLYTTLKEINQAHLKEIKIVKADFVKEMKEFSVGEKMKNEIGTSIFDTDSEISLIKSWIDKNNFRNLNLKLCYRGSERLFSPKNVYDSCDLLSKNKEFLIIYQTECFGRFGIFYGNEKHNNNAFVFEMEQKMRYPVPKELINIDINKNSFPSFFVDDVDESNNKYPYTIKVNVVLKNVDYENIDPYDYAAFGSFKVVEKNMPKSSDVSEIEAFILN